MMFARLIGTPNQPINPASHSVPMATGMRAKIMAVTLRKWMSTISAMAASEYHAA